jgi:rod shape-determining protein MreC
VQLAADYERLDFLRVLRSRTTEVITDPGALLVGPQSDAPTEGNITATEGASDG